MFGSVFSGNLFVNIVFPVSNIRNLFTVQFAEFASRGGGGGGGNVHPD